MPDVALVGSLAVDVHAYPPEAFQNSAEESFAGPITLGVGGCAYNHLRAQLQAGRSCTRKGFGGLLSSPQLDALYAQVGGCAVRKL